MDLKQIERLMAAMGRSGMKRIALKQEGFELELEREESNRPPIPMHPAESMPTTSARLFEERPATGIKEEAQSRYITSPMVGTFYAAPSPEDPPFAKVGDQVDEDTIVCIIEAMKVMNEVKAGIRGTIAEILVISGDPVEFGTKMFRVV